MFYKFILLTKLNSQKAVCKYRNNLFTEHEFITITLSHDVHTVVFSMLHAGFIINTKHKINKIKL